MKLHAKKPWAESLVFMSAVCTWPLPESDPNSVGTVCEQPAVAGHSVAAQTKSGCFNFSHLCSGLLTLHSGNSLALPFTYSGLPTECTRTFNLWEIIKCARLKFMVCIWLQANKRTCRLASTYTQVWEAWVESYQSTVYIRKHNVQCSPSTSTGFNLWNGQK